MQTGSSPYLTQELPKITRIPMRTVLSSNRKEGYCKQKATHRGSLLPLPNLYRYPTPYGLDTLIV